MQFLLHVMQIIGQNKKTSDGVSFMTKAVFSAVRRPKKGRKYRFGKRGATSSKGRASYSRRGGRFPCGGEGAFCGRRVFSRGWRGGFAKRGGGLAGRWGAGCTRAAACGDRVNERMRISGLRCREAAARAVLRTANINARQLSRGRSDFGKRAAAATER